MSSIRQVELAINNNVNDADEAEVAQITAPWNVPVATIAAPAVGGSVPVASVDPIASPQVSIELGAGDDHVQASTDHTKGELSMYELFSRTYGQKYAKLQATFATIGIIAILANSITNGLSFSESNGAKVFTVLSTLMFLYLLGGIGVVKQRHFLKMGLEKMQADIRNTYYSVGFYCFGSIAAFYIKTDLSEADYRPIVLLTARACGVSMVISLLFTFIQEPFSRTRTSVLCFIVLLCHLAVIAQSFFLRDFLYDYFEWRAGPWCEIRYDQPWPGPYQVIFPHPDQSKPETYKCKCKFDDVGNVGITSANMLWFLLSIALFIMSFFDK